MKIEKNKVVSIDYVLKDKDNNELDSSKNGSPLEYLHGNGRLIPGLESKLEGLEEGASIHVEVEPKDAYGDYDEQLIVEVPKEKFDVGTPIEVGMMFQSGAQIVKVVKVSDSVITIDANHELAGKTLCFDVEVKAVRDATEEELTPHSCGGGCSGNCGSCGGDDDDCECDSDSCGGGCSGCGN